MRECFEIGKTWRERLGVWIEDSNTPYRKANFEKLEACLSDERDGARMVVNMGAASLLSFLRDRRFKNFYDRLAEDTIPEIGDQGTDPDRALRESVDRLMNFGDGANIYFGAAALESAGVRFYGEWSLVLKAPVGSTQILDRDSYEFAFEPLASRGGLDALAKGLQGRWDTDLAGMAALKMSDHLGEADRLVTEGRMRNSLLRGEEFIEVHRRGHFTPGEVTEVRQDAVDIAVANQIATAYEQGVPPTVEQMVWTSSRSEVVRKLSAATLPTRVADAESVR